MVKFFNQMIDAFLNVIYNALPKSFIQSWLSQFEKPPFLEYLNWFVPVKGFLILIGIWLGVIATFYMYQIIMRWVKVIGGD